MPRQPLTIAEKQQRQMLRKLARGAGKRIAQQSAVVEQRAIQEAQQMQRLIAERAYRAEMGRGGATAPQRARNLGEAVRSVTSVVRASFGLDQPVKYEYYNGEPNGRILSAKTNLKEILLSVNLSRLFRDDEATIKKTIAILKGATYHEVAHCLWTKDWKTYSHPEGFDFVEHFRAWNLLEDGRIETLLIEKSPVIRNYLLPLLYEVVLSKNDKGWANTVDGAPFLIVRSYLPKGIQRAVINSCRADGRDMNILADMHRVSTAYQQASGWDEQIDHVIEFHNLLARWNEGRIDDHGNGGDPDPHGDHTHTDGDSNPGGTPEPVFKRVSEPQDGDWNRDEIVSAPAPATPDDKSDDDKSDDESDESQGSGQDDTESGDDPKSAQSDANSTKGDSSADKDSESENGDSQSQTTPARDGRAGTGEGGNATRETTVRDTIEEEFANSINEAVTSHELNEVVSQYHKALSRGLQKGTDNTTDITVPDLINTANNITLGMINALDTVVVTPDPSWKYHMDDGAILDLEAFVNRDIGDDSYWVDKDGTGERGHDLAVSLLLDCSASMGHLFTELGIVGYAIRKACDHFNIPCTTVLFGSDSELLWDADDEPRLITMPNLGGTNIGGALLDVGNHRQGKTRHLVVILTDGEWGDVESVRPFFQNGETSLLVGFGMGIHTLQQRGADVAISIGKLLDLPSEVEKAIARFFV